MRSVNVLRLPLSQAPQDRQERVQRQASVIPSWGNMMGTCLRTFQTTFDAKTFSQVAMATCFYLNRTGWINRWIPHVIRKEFHAPCLDMLGSCRQQPRPIWESYAEPCWKTNYIGIHNYHQWVVVRANNSKSTLCIQQNLEFDLANWVLKMRRIPCEAVRSGNMFHFWVPNMLREISCGNFLGQQLKFSSCHVSMYFWSSTGPQSKQLLENWSSYACELTKGKAKTWSPLELFWPKWK